MLTDEIRAQRDAEMLAEGARREREAILAWLNGIGFGDEDQNRAKAEIRQAIAAGQHEETNDG